MKRPIIISLLIVALVLVCAGIGSVLFFALDKPLPVNLFESTRLSAEAEESETLSVDGPITLKVVDEAGKVTITGADKRFLREIEGLVFIPYDAQGQVVDVALMFIHQGCKGFRVAFLCALDEGLFGFHAGFPSRG